MGYVGLPFAIEKTKVGFQVLGVEQNAERADAVNRMESYIGDVPQTVLERAVSKNRLSATTDFARVAEMDVVVICVPTPLTKNLAPDLSYVESVTRAVAAQLRPGQLIALESTTYPGTTDEVMRPILEESGLVQGESFFLAHSPERVDPGNQRYTTQNTNKVVGASDPASLDVATFFYAQTIASVVPVSSAKTAELVKLFENTFRAVNIALVNELALLCDRMELDVWEVLDAAHTKPFGIMPFFPGPGVGGHCIPIDPNYLAWKAKEYGFSTHFIGLAEEINRGMPAFVCEKARRILNRVGVAPSRSKVLVIGASYKKDIGDARESPALAIMRCLLDDGADVRYHDPFVPSLELGGTSLRTVDLAGNVVEEVDLVIIATEHSCVDFTDVVRRAAAVLDTRGVTRHLPIDEEGAAKVVRL